jgi:hypothetical protein
MICLNSANDQHVSFQDLGIMCAEPSVSLRRTLHSLATKIPVVILQRVEERFPDLRERLVSAVCMHRGDIYCLVCWISIAKGTDFNFPSSQFHNDDHMYCK